MTNQQLDEASVSLLAETPYTMKSIVFDSEAGQQSEVEVLEAKRLFGSQWRISYKKNGKQIERYLYMHKCSISDELQMRWMILDIMRDFNNGQ